ncbi:response regulator transcription factor [Streptomyces sp. NPDC060028]|uniref:response regulator transcription factor n=1 Tax=Streptomyces sp. NPDC060028 TaxID=3347041 RepID=UPI0036A45154
MFVLLVEYDFQFAMFLRSGLAGEGIETEWVGDGDAALRRALGGAHDVIVLGATPLGMSRTDLCVRLRRGGATTPVLVLAGQDGEDDTARVLKAGADDHLIGPFSLAELTYRLRLLLMV